MLQPNRLEGSGIVTGEDLAATAATIAASQQASGSLPWPDGHTDPWDHVESAMGLVIGGYLPQAQHAYEWLAKTQQSDGTWACSYDELRVLDAGVDTNQCAYIAVGMWHWWLATRDTGLVKQLFPTVRRALDFVVSMQRESGAIAWSRSANGVVADESLTTGSASTYQALRCGAAIGELLGEPQPDWEVAAGHLRWALNNRPDEFLDKSRFSMDWYYPALGGALSGPAAHQRFDSSWDTFVIDGYGARCVSDRPWVTGAETSELALALAISGRRSQALSLMKDIQCLRREDGSYWTGIVVTDGKFWPVEASSWTSAALLMAFDALADGSTFDLFTGVDLPECPLVSDEARAANRWST